MKESLDRIQETLVSVIVPIYNVEQYVRQCIISIISQSHKNLEIILIDDGSQDASGKIADEMASQDTRISVVHQANSGVSVARNAGLDRATGEYIFFVDADDWVSPDFTESLLALALAHDADLSLSRSIMTSKLQARSDFENIKLMTPEETTEDFLYAEIVIGCWNKLFRRSLIERHSLRFLPQYFMGEGLSFITTFSQISSRVVSTDRKLYYYRRDNIDSATTKISVEKCKNALAAIGNIRKNLIIDSKNVLKALEFHQWWTTFYSLRAAAATGDQLFQKDFYDSCYHYVKNRTYRILFSKRISHRRRFLALIIFLSPSLALFAVEQRLRK